MAPRKSNMRHGRSRESWDKEHWPRRGTVWKRGGGDSTTSLTCRRHSSFPTVAYYLEIGPRRYTLLSFSLLSTSGVGHQTMHCILRTGTGAAAWRRGRGGGGARVVRRPQSWRVDSDDAIQTPTLTLYHTQTYEIGGSVDNEETSNPTMLGQGSPHGPPCPLAIT